MFGNTYFYGTSYWIYILPALVIAMFASAKVQSAYGKYRKQRSNLALTGYEVANLILKNNNIFDIQVVRVNGTMTDYYDSSRKIIALSDEVYSGRSIASMAIAAHESGHAVQLAEGYLPLKLRHSLVNVTQFATSISYLLILLGIFIAPSFGKVGILAYFIIFIFQLVTLPVEYNASSRALNELAKIGADHEDLHGSKKMLNAAALTYLAAMITALMQLLRLISIFGRRRD